MGAPGLGGVAGLAPPRPVVPAAAALPPPHAYTGALSLHVLVVCVIAASAGLLFGYDLGVTGGLLQMPGFTGAFFPHITPDAASGPWCTYADPQLQLFTSSLFLAGMVAVLPAAWLSNAAGRKATMLAAGVCFLGGVGLCAGAVTLAMLICGRILLGFGVGLANGTVPVYLSEMAPPQARGGLNILFQLATTFGLLVAQLVNLGTAGLHPWGWRLSVGLAGVPALVLLCGALVLPETPCSLAQRGRPEQARKVLEHLRGTSHVGEEMDDILAAAEAAQGGSTWAAWRMLFSRECLPELISGSAVAAFSQANGINPMLFYTPAVFASLQLGQHAALLSATLIGGTLFLGTLVSMVLVDRVGRRPLLIQGGAQMLLSLIGVAAVLGVVSRSWPSAGSASGTGTLLPPGAAAAVLTMMCLFVAGFSWSWGPLGWLIPSEITPLQVRSCGQSFFTLVNFAVAFAGTQTFLSLLCAMHWGIYLFFGVWVVAMIAYAALALPETRGVPIEQMEQLWARHWLWGRVVTPRGIGSGGDKGALAPGGAEGQGQWARQRAAAKEGGRGAGDAACLA